VPADVSRDWKRWTAKADHFLRDNFDETDAITFKSYETSEYGSYGSLNAVIRNEIGDLEQLGLLR
jgi:hypothetical protein